MYPVSPSVVSPTRAPVRKLDCAGYSGKGVQINEGLLEQCAGDVWKILSVEDIVQGVGGCIHGIISICRLEVDVRGVEGGEVEPRANIGLRIIVVNMLTVHVVFPVVIRSRVTYKGAISIEISIGIASLLPSTNELLPYVGRCPVSKLEYVIKTIRIREYSI